MFKKRVSCLFVINFVSMIFFGCSDNGIKRSRDELKELSRVDNSDIAVEYKRVDIPTGDSFEIDKNSTIGALIGRYTPNIPLKDIKSFEICGYDDSFRIDNSGYITATKPIENCIDCLNLSVKITDKQDRVYYQDLKLYFRDKKASKSDLNSTNINENESLVPTFKMVSKIDGVGFVDAFKMSGNYLYLASKEVGISLFDMKNIEAPKLISSFNGLDYLSDLEVIDSHTLLVCDGYDGIKILDFNQSNANIISTLPINGWASDAKLLTDQNISYIASGSDGVLVVTLGDVNSTKIVTSLDTFGYSEKIDLMSIKDKKIAFVADGFDGLKIIDLSDDNNISLISSLPLNDWAKSLALSSDDSRLYIAQKSGGIATVDIKDIQAPTVLKENLFDEPIINLAISNNDKLLFASTTKEELLILDIKESGELSIKSSLKVDGIINQVEYDDIEKKLYIATTKGFYIYELK